MIPSCTDSVCLVMDFEEQVVKLHFSHFCAGPVSGFESGSSPHWCSISFVH